MKIITLVLVFAVTAAAAAPAAQQPLSPTAEAGAVRQMAAAIPAGSRIKLQTAEGKRLTATLMTITDDGVIVKREARRPEPALAIPFADIVRLQREERGGMSVGKAIALGVAAGAGAIVTMFAIALQLD